nr:hypothetical protein [Acidithiobacillus ferrooxidans]
MAEKVQSFQPEDGQAPQRGHNGQVGIAHAEIPHQAFHGLPLIHFQRQPHMGVVQLRHGLQRAATQHPALYLRAFRDQYSIPYPLETARNLIILNCK